VIALAGLYEYLGLVAALPPVRWAAYLGAVGAVSLPYLVDPAERGVALAVGATIVLTAVGALLVRDREEITLRVALTVLGPVYLAVPMGLLVALRELPDGAGAVANVLVGTWAFDTFSYFGGRMWGSRPVAPRTSPKKTVEGLAVGVVGGTLAVWVAGLYMDWIDHLESLALGVVICAFAYAGDLFESLFKRDIGVKDSGRILGAHGGVLDRFDAIMFTATAGYFATVWLV
jgi:phosphatidate cytidylyltransferase